MLSFLVGTLFLSRDFPSISFAATSNLFSSRGLCPSPRSGSYQFFSLWFLAHYQDPFSKHQPPSLCSLQPPLLSSPASSWPWPPRYLVCIFPHKSGQSSDIFNVAKGTTPIFSVIWVYTLLPFVITFSSFTSLDYCSYIIDFNSMVNLTFHSQLYGHHM